MHVVFAIYPANPSQERATRASIVFAFPLDFPFIYQSRPECQCPSIRRYHAKSNPPPQEIRPPFALHSPCCFQTIPDSINEHSQAIQLFHFTTLPHQHHQHQSPRSFSRSTSYSRATGAGVGVATTCTPPPAPLELCGRISCPGLTPRLPISTTLFAEGTPFASTIFFTGTLCGPAACA